MGKEIVIGPFPFEKAKKRLANIQYHSGKFKTGGRPYIGDLETSYGYGKKIGLVSLDKKVRTRIDWDEEKHAHFNYEDFEHDFKICILISDLTYPQYKRFVKNLNKGLTKDNIDIQIWRSRREESGIPLDGYIRNFVIESSNPIIFREPSRVYRRAMKGYPTFLTDEKVR